ncbi:MAG: DUF5677 domain-containing protein, partial [Methanotrichaceae archaeon]
MDRSELLIEPILDAVDKAPLLDKEKLNESSSIETIKKIFIDKIPDIRSRNKLATGIFSGLLREKRGEGYSVQDYWCVPLDMLLLEIEFARATIGYYGRHISPKVPADKRNLEAALFFLQRRACVVASEIHCLLENGYADGAESRWRTLNELAITSAFLLQKGDEIAERYTKYRAVIDLRKNKTLKDQAENHLSNPGPNQSLETRDAIEKSIETFSEIIMSLEEEVSKLCDRFGPSFGNYPNGWAAAAFSNNHKKRVVSLTEMANTVIGSTLIPYYKLSVRAFANDGVHQGSVGDVRSRGDFGPTDTVILGASPVGLYLPISNTAEDLAVTTNALLSILPMWQS